MDARRRCPRSTTRLAEWLARLERRMSVIRPADRPRDPRQPRPADGRGDVRAGRRRDRHGVGAVGRVDRHGRGARAARRRPGPLRRARLPPGGRERERDDRDCGARPAEFETRPSSTRALIALDGTPNKSRLGANAILPCRSRSPGRAPRSAGVPLYHHFADDARPARATLPRLTINLFSGGKHAGGQVPIQDVLVVPTRRRRSTTGWRRRTPSTRPRRS